MERIVLYECELACKKLALTYLKEYAMVLSVMRHARSHWMVSIDTIPSTIDPSTEEAKVLDWPFLSSIAQLTKS
jgi:hypothetical protein